MSAPRTLLPYQRRWVQDGAALAVAEKSRRIGLSWATAYQAVMHAAEGAGNVQYQSYSRDQARDWIGDAADWARALQRGAGAVGEVLIDADDERIPAFQVPFPGGKTVTALSSAPRALRGKGRPGDLAVVDEAAFVDSLDEVLKAALAYLTWGGRVRILSTHNGEASAFAALCRDLREGRRPGSLHRIPLRRAVDEGLYRRICAVTGEAWTEAGETAWEAELRAGYGRHAAEELDCVPAPEAAAWLSWEGIRAVEHAEAGDPGRYGGGHAYLGVDIARRRDLWVAAAVEPVGDVRWVRELRVERDIPFSAQGAIIAELLGRYRVIRVAVDQTGMGEAVVEQWQERHGRHLVEGVLMTGPRRLDVATALRGAVEDRRLRIPADDDLRADLHAVRAEQGPTGAPRLVAGAGADGHADRFWALALAVAAAAAPPGDYALHRVGLQRRPGGGIHQRLAALGRTRGASMRWERGAL